MCLLGPFVCMLAAWQTAIVEQVLCQLGLTLHRHANGASSATADVSAVHQGFGAHLWSIERIHLEVRSAGEYAWQRILHAGGR